MRSNGGFNKVIHRVGVSGLIRVLEVIIKFLLNIVLAKALGLEGVGVFYVAMTITTISSVVAKLGLDQYLMRQITVLRDRDRAIETVSLVMKSLILTLVVSTLLSIFLYLNNNNISIYIFSMPKMMEPLGIMVWAIPFLSVSTLVSWILRSYNKLVISQLVFSLIWPLLLLSLVVMIGGGLEDISYEYILAVIFTAGYSIYQLSKCISPFKFEFKKYHYRNLIKVAKGFYIIALIEVLLQWSPILILGMTSDSEEVGLYSIGYRIAYFVAFGLLSVNIIVGPRFASLYGSGKAIELKKLVNKITVVSGIIGIFAGVCIISLSSELLKLFGHQFISGQPVVIIVSLAYILASLCGPVGVLLAMTNKENYLKTNVTISLIITVITVSFFSFKYGSIGAAIGVAFGISVSNLLSLITVRRLLGYWTFAIKTNI